MPPRDCRVVLDTNILVRGFVNLGSRSGQILRACERREVVPLLSAAVIAEYRHILRHPNLVSRYPQLDEPAVATALERLIYVGDLCRGIRAQFAYPRDPKDSHLIELAIEGRATHLISTDTDLLALPAGRDDSAKRFRQRLPNLRVVTPEEFVRLLGGELSPD